MTKATTNPYPSSLPLETTIKGRLLVASTVTVLLIATTMAVVQYWAASQSQSAINDAIRGQALFSAVQALERGLTRQSLSPEDWRLVEQDLAAAEENLSDQSPARTALGNLRAVLAKEATTVSPEAAALAGSLVQLARAESNRLDQRALDTSTTLAAGGVIARVVSAAVLFLAVAAYFQRLVRQPLQQLKTATELLSQADSGRRIEWRGDGEFRPLVDTFNRLMSELELTTVSRKEVRADAEELRAMVSSVPDLVLSITRDGRIQVMNAARRFGPLLPFLLRAQRLVEILPAPDVSAVEDRLASAFAAPTLATPPLTIRPLRNLRTYEVRIVATSPDAALLMVRDVSRLTRAEVRRKASVHALTKTLSEWRTTIDALDEMIVVLDHEGLIRRLNRASLATLGGGFADWIGQPVVRLRAVAPFGEVLAQIERAGSSVVEGQIAPADSPRRWAFSARLAVVPGDPGPLTVIVCRDTTALFSLQNALRRSDAMASVGALVADVAHEIRNPLFGISSILDAWAVKGDRADLPRYLSMLGGEVARMRSLMADLLDYARPGSGVRSVVPLVEIVDAAVRASKPLASRLGVQVSTAIGDAYVEVERDRLERAMVNLIENAIHFSPRGAAVLVESGREAPGAEFARVRVSDRGPGLAADILPAVFEPFATRRKGGTGLGLAIVKRVLSEHGGWVMARNGAQGAILEIFLPRAVSSAEATTERRLA